MLNQVIMMGRLVRDPELRTAGETPVAHMRIAVDRDFKNQAGEREADFFDVVAWRSTAEFACKYFSKGSQMIVDGRLQSRNWEDKDGNKRVAIEIVADNLYFAGSKRDSGDDAAPEQAAIPAADPDELPF